jgi:hypothetical protein
MTSESSRHCCGEPNAQRAECADRRHIGAAADAATASALLPARVPFAADPRGQHRPPIPRAEIAAGPARRDRRRSCAPSSPPIRAVDIPADRAVNIARRSCAPGSPLIRASSSC